MVHSTIRGLAIAAVTETKTTSLSGFSVYLERRVATLLLFGFSSGLPLMLVFSTLSFWLREAGVTRTSIGFFSWVALAYGFKWVWSPLVDRLRLPLLTVLMGRRRSWLLFSQCAVVLALVGMAFTDPQQQLMLLAVYAVVVAFASATQDIAIDAFRIESAPERQQAAMAASYMIGYRLAMICAGAGALAIAAMSSASDAYSFSAWSTAYLVMAGLMGIGILTTLFSHEPEVDLHRVSDTQQTVRRRFQERGWPLPLAGLLAWGKTAVVDPFGDFFGRYRWYALLILLLIATYRISDIVMGVMSNAFYVDMGFTKGEVAAISKVYGVAMTLIGAAIGGVLVNRLGTLRILFMGALLAAATNLLFALLATQGHDLRLLSLVISIDNLSAGIATAAFITFLSGLTNKAYSATQYALFSSVMVLLPKFIAGFTGMYVDTFGYVNFFTATALLGAPVLVLILLVAKGMTRLQLDAGEALRDERHSNAPA